MQPMRPAMLIPVFLALALLWPIPAMAAGDASPGLIWGVPFVGMLGSIALLPMFAERFWHRRMGLVSLGWCIALVLPMAIGGGIVAAAGMVWHAVLIEYLPFVSLLAALYIVGGGILLRGGPWGTPAGNCLLLGIGTILAGVMGTTGAAMVLIHPLLRANAHRVRKTHLAVFFILLVANAGGATTPLGDPPLYVGFLHGVPFGWPVRNLGLPLLVLALPLLAAFWLLDRRLAAGEKSPEPAQPLQLRGWGNVGLLAIIVATVVLQGFWHPVDVRLFGQGIGAERLVAMAIFAVVAGISLRITPRAVHQANMFSWAPIEEVAILFAAIFITIGPLMDMLHAGMHGPLAPLLRLNADAEGHPLPLATFWMAGLLSAFLDNAPTYLVFFELAGGDAARLTGPLNASLTALSAGAVFFGALTYIGNAPNMMVRAIAAHRGVRMPGFFGYMLWSSALLLPGFVLLSLVFFR